MTPAEPTTPILDPNATVPSPTVPLVDDVPFEDVIRAHNHFHDELRAGRVDPDLKLWNQHIAYYEGRIIDHDVDSTALFHRVSALPGLEPALIVWYFPELFDAIPS
ncbi:MAG: hypothetical protein C0467_23945 [Planctomycetaceae bacterium]|nr:hypothetical protein [Planctomycetaceae bacterium]